MKNLSQKTFPFAVVLVFVTLLGCDNSPPLNVTPSVPNPSSDAPSGKVEWPPASKNTKFTPAKNILAKNFMVVYDQSGSMSEKACNDRSMTKESASITALKEFAKVVPQDANLGLVIMFGTNKIQLKVPLGSGKSNRDSFVSEVDAAGPDGNTPLYAAMAMGFNTLLEQASTQFGYGEYHLVVVTDGEYNSGPNPIKVVEAAAKTPIVIHTIGFCIKGGHSLNQQGVTLYQEASDLVTLRKGLAEVLAEAPRFDATFKQQ